MGSSPGVGSSMCKGLAVGVGGHGGSGEPEATRGLELRAWGVWYVYVYGSAQRHCKQ
jgi:hypothetical protein